jgi:hypothetical protein
MKIMKSLSDVFTVPGLIAIGLLLGGTAIFFWFLFAIEQARAEPPRAISAEMHEACANMPRGNQEMENGRKQCFSELYGQGRYKVGRRHVGDNRDDEATSGEVQE